MSNYFTLLMPELKAELSRRGLITSGRKMELLVRLVNHDKIHCNIAKKTTIIPFSGGRTFLGETGQDPAILVGEKITHWKLNDAGSNMKFFFASGKMVNIEGGMLRYAQISVDRNLEAALAALPGGDWCTMQKGTAPDTPLSILEAVLATRTSVAAKTILAITGYVQEAWEEQHLVIGLRLDGMSEMGFVYSYDSEDDAMSGAFGDVTMEKMKTGSSGGGDK